MCQIEKDKNYDSYLNMPQLQKLGIVGRLDEWTSAAHDLLNNTNESDGPGY
jgi:hypothetical protein